MKKAEEGMYVLTQLTNAFKWFFQYLWSELFEINVKIDCSLFTRDKLEDTIFNYS